MRLPIFLIPFRLGAAVLLFHFVGAMLLPGQFGWRHAVAITFAVWNCTEASGDFVLNAVHWRYESLRDWIQLCGK